MVVVLEQKQQFNSQLRCDSVRLDMLSRYDCYDSEPGLLTVTLIPFVYFANKQETSAPPPSNGNSAPRGPYHPGGQHTLTQPLKISI